ncbi:MAG: molybdopterin cofactor-binding domain-containing protein, partial [Variovorax sp.]|nr:molybdopterin cofactor-binding domain-containing protein [Variovorax sp.]
WVEDRRENLLGSNHSREIDCEIEIACEKDGTILALRGRAEKIPVSRLYAHLFRAM